jgi:hypothetical protein
LPTATFTTAGQQQQQLLMWLYERLLPRGDLQAAAAIPAAISYSSYLLLEEVLPRTDMLKS